MPGSRRNRRSRSRRSPSQRTMAINPPTRVQNGADKTRDSCLSSPDWRPRIRTNLPCHIRIVVLADHHGCRLPQPGNFGAVTAPACRKGYGRSVGSTVKGPSSRRISDLRCMDASAEEMKYREHFVDVRDPALRRKCPAVRLALWLPRTPSIRTPASTRSERLVRP